VVIIIRLLILISLISCANIQENTLVDRGPAQSYEETRILYNRLIKNITQKVVEDINQEYSLGIELNKTSTKRFLSRLRDSAFISKNKAKLIALKYQDALIFQQVFRAVKYSILYPFLAYTGNAHLIPIVGAGLLNSNVMTGIYIVARKTFENFQVVRRYNYSKNSLEKIITIAISEDTKPVNIINLNNKKYTMTNKQLEELITDKDFILKAKKFKEMKSLYAQILISKISTHHESYNLYLEQLSSIQESKYLEADLSKVRHQTLEAKILIKKDIQQIKAKRFQISPLKYYSKKARMLRKIENALTQKIDTTLRQLNHHLYISVSQERPIKEYNTKRMTQKLNIYLKNLNDYKDFLETQDLEKLSSFLKDRNIEVDLTDSTSCSIRGF